MPSPSPTVESKPAPRGRVEDTAPEIISSLESQERLQESSQDASYKSTPEQKSPESAHAVPAASPPLPPHKQSTHGRPSETEHHNVSDNIARVPDEHLPSHRERQRWDFSKRLSELMDELLPKLAVVTQKVNTYTGTDYSGVEALRREIKEQENLVKARRAAIETAKQSLDAAHAQQASAQKEVVALLERKHSWSANDLERYMALIRSEHINDQAIKHAKESVVSAEAALEEARTQLEKRERAQYHEEQIWSDTIRRNSTWVTFGLMGVNIFLLLLSLAILEPWRRRRMVREIRGALEANKIAMETSPVLSSASTGQFVPSNIAAIEAEIDSVMETPPKPLESGTPSGANTGIEALPRVGAEDTVSVASDIDSSNVLDGVILPVSGTTVPGAATLVPADKDMAGQADVDIREEVAVSEQSREPPKSWQSKVASVAQDVVSDRIIAMRRIDFTTAVLQGAAAGAVITATIIAMIRPP